MFEIDFMGANFENFFVLSSLIYKHFIGNATGVTLSAPGAVCSE